MSWDVELTYPNHTVARVDRHEEGGTYCVGGTEYAELNITYNYSRCYCAAGGKGTCEMLDGKTARETIPELRRLVAELGTERSDDYWEPTNGNAGYVLSILLGWAEQHPDAVWSVT